MCRFVLTSLSSFGAVFSGGQMLIGGLLEEQSSTQTDFIPSLWQAKQPLFNCCVQQHMAHTSCRPVKHLLLLYSKCNPTHLPCLHITLNSSTEAANRVRIYTLFWRDPLHQLQIPLQTDKTKEWKHVNAFSMLSKLFLLMQGENRAWPSVQYYATYSKTHWEKLCQRVALTLHIWGFSCKSLLLGLPNQQCMSPRLRFLHSSFSVRSKHHDHQYHFHPQLLQGGAASGLTSNQ